VTLEVHPDAVGSIPPFGMVDTPTQGGRLTGAIALTGWALTWALLVDVCIPVVCGQAYVCRVGAIPRVVCVDCQVTTLGYASVCGEPPTWSCIKRIRRAAPGLRIRSSNMLPNVLYTPQGGVGRIDLWAMAGGEGGVTVLGRTTIDQDPARDISPTTRSPETLWGD
jgi:hypothetical protein